MFRRAARRATRQRVAAALLALLIQAIALLLFRASRQPGVPEPQSGPPVFLQAIQVPEPAPGRAPDEPDKRRRTVDRSTVPPAIEPVVIAPPAASTAITLPQADFRGPLADAAKHAADQAAAHAAQGDPLHSSPDVLKLPARPTRGHEPGVPTVRGKEVVTVEFDDGWICTYTRQPVLLSQTFEPWSQQRPASCTHKGDGAESAPLLDVEALKPGYLRQPLPLPKEPKGPPAAP